MTWRVADVMTTEVVTVGPETGFKSCVDMLRVHSISALPVIAADGALLGIVSEFDLMLKEEGHDRQQRPSRPGGTRMAAELMSSPPICVQPGASLSEAARLMHRKHVKRLPVVDAKGQLLGIVSRADLLKPFLRSDESIEREISEYLLSEVLWIDRRSVQVYVHDGQVRLSGELETRTLRDLLVRMVEDIEGVVSVDSTLTHRLDNSHLRADLAPLTAQVSARDARL